MAGETVNVTETVTKAATVAQRVTTPLEVPVVRKLVAVKGQTRWAHANHGIDCGGVHRFCTHGSFKAARALVWKSIAQFSFHAMKYTARGICVLIC